MFTPTWNERFLDLAGHVAQWSKDPSTKVGAVIVRPNRTVAALGYNGFPRGVRDHYEDRDHKLLRTVHAEVNAILSASESLTGYSLYVTPMFPCSNCAAIIIQSGISTVIARSVQDRPDWRISLRAAEDMFFQAGVDFSFA